MKRLILLAAVLFFGLTGAAPVYSSTYFLFNQWGGTWHDANKTGVDDSLMCWAASAANILDWGNWDTPVYNTETKIFQEFKNHWTNNRGWQSWAWQWWLKGTSPPSKSYAYVNVPGGGNYYPGVPFYSLYSVAFGANEIASMDQLMHKGYGISLVIGTASGASHAITAWGFDYTITNGKTNYTAVYITDSDDRINVLKRMGLAYNNTNGWYFTSGYTNWKINGVYALDSQNPAAAPIVPAWWMFASGLILLGGAGLRRRMLN